ncbi:MAG TPA: four helix bundle protein [Anaerolineales bacterium]
MAKDVAFEDWLVTLPVQVRSDPLWNSAYYRLAMYIYDLAWHDCDLLMKDLRGREVSRQLVRSIGSVSANIEEAYGRGIESADGLRILRIALGETREARGWYLRAKFLLPNACLNNRIDLLSDLIGMIVNIISNRRRSSNK